MALPSPISLPLAESPVHACSYFPERLARTRAFMTDRLPPELYQRFMDAGFRRSGRVVYQPSCPSCADCIPIRIPVARFVPGKSHRRVQRKNEDLLVTVGKPWATDEKFALYQRYLAEWHGTVSEPDDDPRAAFEAFLYSSPVETVEFTYRLPETGQLLAVGLCDVCEASLSSVYFYHDPSHHKRSLGTFGLLTEIAFASRAGIPYYYLGYWVPRCSTMDYKASFRPHELLGADGVWRAGEGVK